MKTTFFDFANSDSTVTYHDALYMARVPGFTHGWTVFPGGDGDQPFVVYADDGHGNGDFVGGFATVAAAVRETQRLVVEAQHAAAWKYGEPDHDPDEWEVDARMAEAQAFFPEMNGGR